MSEDIRRRLEMVEQDGRQSPEDEIHMLNVWHHYSKDVAALLERVGELESKYREWLEAWEAADERVEELKAENEALHTALEASGERREQVEAENERLRRLFSAKPAVSSQRQLPPGFRTSGPRSD